MLKNIFIAATLCLGAGFAASAQGTGKAAKPATTSFTTSMVSAGDIKPAAGEVTAEVQLNLTGANTVGLNVNQLRGRYFLSPDMAFRMSFTLDVERNSNVEPNPTGTGTVDVSDSRTLISIAPGIEKHFAGTERLSPYVAGVVSISKLFASQETATQEVSGSNGTDRAFFGLGLGVGAGADYYFAKHVYLGVEFGLGFEYQMEGDIETTPKAGGNSVTNKGEGSTLRFNPSANGGLRLGFVF